MTAVSAPTQLASVAASSSAPVPGAKNAPAGQDTPPADFASALKALQRQAGDIDSAAAGQAAAAPGEMAAALRELSQALGQSSALPGTITEITAALNELVKGQKKDELAADRGLPIDIAAMLTQLNASVVALPMPPAASAIDANGERFDPDTLGIDVDARKKHFAGQELVADARTAKASASTDGLLTPDESESKAKLALPESLADTRLSASGAEQHAARGVHTERIKLDVATPVQAPNWSAEVGQRVVWMAKNSVQEAQLSVNPPHLGPIEITLSLKDDNATARFFSPHPEIREMLEQAMPRLREMLSGAGVQLGQSDVGAQSQQAFQQFANARNGAANGRNFGDEHPSLQAQNTVISAVTVRTMAGNGLVDIFA